jgi:hypothetical protein
MSTFGLARQSALTILTALAWATTCHAQAARTWVSGVGDDANPCSRTAPCLTFAGAISKTAAGGEINVLDPGGFGAVTITKAITIDGSGGSIAGVLASGTNGIVVNAGTSDVITLRNLEIDGRGTGLNGILLLGGKQLNVERCTIWGFTQQGILFTPSASAQLYVRDSTIRNNVGAGIYIGPNGVVAQAAITDVRLLGNERGFQAADGAVVSVTRSMASNNVHNGFAAYGATLGSDVTLEDSVASGNGNVGVRAVGTAVIRLSNMSIVHNGTGMDVVSGGTLASFANNRVTGNVVADGAPTLTLTPR